MTNADDLLLNILFFSVHTTKVLKENKINQYFQDFNALYMASYRKGVFVNFKNKLNSCNNTGNLIELTQEMKFIDQHKKKI